MISHRKGWLLLLMGAGWLICGAASAAPFEGRVLTPAGEPLGGALVEFIGTSGERLAVGRSDPQGHFRLAAEGAERVRIRAAGYATLETPIAEGIAELRLEPIRIEQRLEVTAAAPELSAALDLTAELLARSVGGDLAESLRGTPGLSAVRRGPLNLEPTVRGLQESQVAMFVDGTRTFAAGPARMDSDLSHVSLAAAEKVRVVKGPFALTWGSGALSAVRVDSADPGFGPLEWQGSAAVRWTENASASAHGLVSRRGERSTFSLFAEGRQGDDYEDGAGVTVPGDYESNTARLRFGWLLGDDTRLDYQGGYQEQRDIDYPGRLLDATFFYTRSHALSLHRERVGSGFSEIYGQLYVNRKDHRMNNDEKPTAQPMAGRIPPFALRVDLPTESNTTGGRFFVAGERGNWRLKVGADAYLAEQTARRRISRREPERLLFDDIVWPEAEIANQGIYGQAVRVWDRAEVSFGLRLDRVEAKAGEVSEFFRANTAGDLDQDESHLGVALSGRWRLADGWTVSAGFGRASRTATALERYSDRFPATKFQISAEFLGNPDLDPETSLELDLGSQWVVGRLLVEGEVFYREIDDYITVVADASVPKRLPLSPPTVFRYINGDSATFYGGELRLRQEVGEWVTWRASLASTRGDDDELDEPVLGIEPTSGTLALTLRHPSGRWWGDLSVRLVERQDRVAAARFEVETPGFTRLDLALGSRLGEALELEVGATNLTDEDYAEHLNARVPFTGERVTEPGRSLFARLKLEL
ncbi:MAG: TonB-dependent receptor [Acidobacteriota bacterium]